VKNGSDVAGSWEVRFTSDASGMDASVRPTRDGKGDRNVVRPARRGLCRHGPREARQGASGPFRHLARITWTTRGECDMPRGCPVLSYRFPRSSRGFGLT
jgi:hypothetical protein